MGARGGGRGRSRSRGAGGRWVGVGAGAGGGRSVTCLSPEKRSAAWKGKGAGGARWSVAAARCRFGDGVVAARMLAR
jgi:hypothetical protein